MKKYRLHRGLQLKGYTKIDSTITVEKTGLMELTVKKGTFTDTIGTKFKLKNDVVIPIIPDTDNYIALKYNKTHKETEVLHETDIDYMVESHEVEIVTLVGWGWFKIPLGTTDISSIPLYQMLWIEAVGIKHEVVLDPETMKPRRIKKIKVTKAQKDKLKEYDIDTELEEV